MLVNAVCQWSTDGATPICVYRLGRALGRKCVFVGPSENPRRLDAIYRAPTHQHWEHCPRPLAESTRLDFRISHTNSVSLTGLRACGYLLQEELIRRGDGDTSGPNRVWLNIFRGLWTDITRGALPSCHPQLLTMQYTASHREKPGFLLEEDPADSPLGDHRRNVTKSEQTVPCGDQRFSSRSGLRFITRFWSFKRTNTKSLATQSNEYVTGDSPFVVGSNTHACHWICGGSGDWDWGNSSQSTRQCGR